MSRVHQEYEKAKHNLALALQGVPVERQAEVLRIVLDWEVDPDSEFFLIFAAIGHLKVLIEDAPEDWRQLFKDLYKELNGWTDLTTEQLQNFSVQTETIKNLALSCNRLGSSLSSLEQTSVQQIEQLKNLEQLSISLNFIKSELPKLQEISGELKDCLTPLLEALQMIEAKDIPGIENRSLSEIFSLVMEPEKRPKLNPQSAREKLINDLAKQIIEQLKTLLSEKKAQPKTLQPIPSPQEPKPKTSTWSFELASTTAILTVCFVGFSLMSGFVGWQMRYWQIQASTDFQLGQQILEWNRSVLEKARQQGKAKTTLWIVPPESESSSTRLERSND